MTSATLDAVFSRFRPSFRDEQDAVAFAVHSHVLLQGAYLVSLSDSEQQDTDADIGGCPEGWNASADSYCFRYLDTTSSCGLVVKMLRMDDTLVVHGARKADGGIFSCNISVPDHVRGDVQWPVSHVASPEQVLTTSGLSTLQSVLKSQLIDKLLPRTKTQQRQQSGASAIYTEPRRNHLPYPDDPLRAGPPRVPAGGDFGSDLDPFRSPGVPGADGNLMGPNHDLFRGGPRVGRRDLRVPPGARFDPFGPGGPNHPRDPDPDHLRPAPGAQDPFGFGPSRFQGSSRGFGGGGNFGGFM